MVGRSDRAREGTRYGPLLHRVCERPRRLSGHDRAGQYRSQHRRALRPDLPQVTIRDIVRTQHMLMEHLGIGAWLSVVGGSMGGMQVLEWGAMFPEHVRSLAPIATTAAASPQQIGWSAVQRMAIAQDPKWRGGWYYDAPDGDGPWHGLALAREISQITYRTTEVFDERFGRALHDSRDELGVGPIRGRVLSRSSRPEAGSAVRRELVPRVEQGDGPARCRPSPWGY